MQNESGSKLHKYKSDIAIICSGENKRSSWTDLHKRNMCLDINYIGEKIGKLV